MTRRNACPAHGGRRRHSVPRRRVQRMIWAAVLACAAASVSVAPSAVADPRDSLRAAVIAARGTSCGPLRSDPRVEQTADEVNQSENKWLNNTARARPVPDALPVLKDLGYGGSKATILLGASTTDGDAIKALLLQGYRAIPDCTYTDYGVSTLYNQPKGEILTTLVLAA